MAKYLPIYLFIYLFICLSIYLSVCLSICLSVCLSVYLCIYPRAQTVSRRLTNSFCHFSLSFIGALAAGVPGDVKGYYSAWEIYGRLPWKVLLQPAINKAKHGFQIGISLYESMTSEKEHLKKDEGLRQEP